MALQNSRDADGPRLPWWRVPMVWLVIGGPAVVVVAAIITAVIAVRGADPVIGQEPESKFSERPAVQGRNHAATPTDRR
jgi:uncharacterized protein